MYGLRLGVLASILTLCLTTSGALAQTPALQKVSVNYAARTGTTWPMYVAKEGGYYQKYGLDVNLVFATHPAGIAMVVGGDAVMTNYPLEQAMPASSRDGSLVIIGSQYKKSSFALMAPKSFSSVRQLKGKRIGVSQIGDAPYNYSVGLLAKAGLTPKDVQWIPIGTDANGRAAALAAGRVDATMIPAPAYFKIEQQGYVSLANTSDYDDIFAPTVSVFKKSTVAANPKLAESLLKAQAEAIKRMYDDKDFAVKAYLKYNPMDDPADVAQVYDLYTKRNAYERIPYVPAAAVQYVIAHPVDAQLGAQLKAYDFRKVIDNGTVDRLIKEGFFEQLFGPSIKAEEQSKAKLAFR